MYHDLGYPKPMRPSFDGLAIPWRQMLMGTSRVFVSIAKKYLISQAFLDMAMFKIYQLSKTVARSYFRTSEINVFTPDKCGLTLNCRPGTSNVVLSSDKKQLGN
jgi:hypothetical protein